MTSPLHAVQGSQVKRSLGTISAIFPAEFRRNRPGRKRHILAKLFAQPFITLQGEQPRKASFRLQCQVLQMVSLSTVHVAQASVSSDVGLLSARLEVEPNPQQCVRIERAATTSSGSNRHFTFLLHPSVGQAGYQGSFSGSSLSIQGDDQQSTVSSCRGYQHQVSRITLHS